MNKSKLFMIISVCILIISVVGSTVAYYSVQLFSVDADAITYGLDYFINYKKGQSITGTLDPSSNYITGQNATIELWKDAESPYEIYGHIYLDLTTLSDNMSNLGALNYTVVNDEQLVSTGIITKNTENTILLKGNIPLSTEVELYTIYIWLDASKIDDNISGDAISLSVRCEATMEEVY